MTDKPDAKTVLEKPSRIKCTCGHIAAEHGGQGCFECPCEASMHEVMKVGYRDALAASEAEAQVLRARVEALERGLDNIRRLTEAPVNRGAMTARQQAVLMNAMHQVVALASAGGSR